MPGCELEVTEVEPGYGSRIKAIRLENDMTLEDLAEQAGLSVSLLSEVENGKKDLSIQSLRRVAKALSVPLFVLFNEPGDPDLVVRRDKRTRVTLPPHKITYELLSANLKGSLEMMLAEYEPGMVSSDELLAHSGEECTFVLSGSMEVEMPHATYLLESGDAITIPPSVPHRYRNVGDDRLIVVSALTPPSI